VSEWPLWPLTVPQSTKEQDMHEVERGAWPPMPSDLGSTGAQARERLQERLAHVGQVVQ
jgi:hypothetical protein